MDIFERITELSKVIKNDNENFQAIRDISVLLLDIGYNKEAFKYLKYLSQIFPNDAKIQFNLGYVCEKLNKRDLAKICYEKASEIVPDEVDYTYNLALMYLNEGQYKHAFDLFKKILLSNGQDGNTYYNIGIICEKQNKYNLALSCFEKAYKINQNDKIALYNIAFCHFKLKNYDFAIEFYEKLLESTPDYSWGYFSLASVYWKINNVEKAISNLKKTIELNENDFEAILLLVKIYIKLKDFDQAINFLDTCSNPRIGDLLYIKAQIFKKMDDLEQSRIYLKKVRENIETFSFKTLKELVKEIRSL